MWFFHRFLLLLLLSIPANVARVDWLYDAVPKWVKSSKKTILESQKIIGSEEIYALKSFT